MWKKLLTPTLIVTLATLFALTWYCSIKAEEYFGLWVERSKQYAPAITTTKLVSYDRRFFSAEALTTIDIRGLGRYDFHHLIRHYAWGVTMITTPVTEPGLPSLFNGLRIVTDVGPTGAVRSRLSLPQLTMETPDGSTVSIDRIAGEAQVNATATEGSWDISLEQIRISVDKYSRLVITGINSAAEMKNLDQFPLGHTRTRINSLALETTAGRPFVMNGLNLDGTNFFAPEQHYVTRSEMSFAGVQAGDSAFTDGRLVLELNGLDARVINALLTARDSLHRHISAGSISDDELTEKVVLPVYHTLLQSGATLVLEHVALATTGGQLTGAGRAHLKPSTPGADLDELFDRIDLGLQFDFDVVILARLNQLVEQIQGTSTNVSVKEEELRMIFGGLTQLGFLSQEEGERFRLRIAYADGEIKLNDQPFRLF